MAFCVYKDLDMDITVIQEPSEDLPSSPECMRPNNNCMDDDDCDMYSYPCDSCDLEFSSGMSLWKHVKNMHGGRLTAQLRNMVNTYGAENHDIIGEIGNQKENNVDLNTRDIGEEETKAEDADTKDINTSDFTGEIISEFSSRIPNDIGEVETKAEDADTKDINTSDFTGEIISESSSRIPNDSNTSDFIGEMVTQTQDVDTKDINTRHIFWETGTQAMDEDTKDINMCDFTGEMEMEAEDVKDINMRYIIEERDSHERNGDCIEARIQDNVSEDEVICKCPKCGKEFNTNSALETHKCLRRVSSVPCQECGKTFPHPSDLKTHMSVHSKRKLYSCKHRGCGKTFSIQRNLNRHRRIHREENPFSCSQCEITFTQSSELKDHMRIHSGEGNFSIKQSPSSSPVSPEHVDLEDTLDIKAEALDTNDFQAVVETFRRLHPALRQRDPTGVLDSKLKEWRAKCMAAVGLESEKTYFGGTYKEHLAVSVMSRRCFDAALSIMTQYRLNQHPKQKSTIVNRALFKEVPGTRDEEALYEALLDFRDGRTGKENFNRTLKIMKQGKQKDEMTWKRENEQLRLELKRQQAIVESQEKRIASLEEELRVLKQTVVEADLTHGTREDDNMTIGKMMEGKDEETGMWFKVKIIEKGNSRVKVHWMSYSKYYDSWIDQSLLRPLKPKFSEGKKVNARFNVTNRTTYAAVVVAVDGDKVLLRYEDDVERKIHQRYVEEQRHSAV